MIPGAVSEVARGQMAEQPVRRPLASHEQQHGGHVVHALIVVDARVAAVHGGGRQHAVQRLTPLVPHGLRPTWPP